VKTAERYRFKNPKFGNAEVILPLTLVKNGFDYRYCSPKNFFQYDLRILKKIEMGPKLFEGTGSAAGKVMSAARQAIL
jgi:hypothetical protein